MNSEMTYYISDSYSPYLHCSFSVAKLFNCTVICTCVRSIALLGHRQALLLKVNQLRNFCVVCATVTTANNLNAIKKATIQSKHFAF